MNEFKIFEFLLYTDAKIIDKMRTKCPPHIDWNVDLMSTNFAYSADFSSKFTIPYLSAKRQTIISWVC